MILTPPNSSEEARCYRFSQRNFISKEQNGEICVRRRKWRGYVSNSGSHFFQRVQENCLGESHWKLSFLTPWLFFSICLPIFKETGLVYHKRMVPKHCTHLLVGKQQVLPRIFLRSILTIYREHFQTEGTRGNALSMGSPY